MSRTRRVITDRIGALPIVIFHADGAASALDAQDMKNSREVGSAGVFEPQVDGRHLRFRYEEGQFIDAETKSRWNVFGQCISGSLRGKSLRRVAHGDYFAFAWLAFKPQAEIFVE